MQDFRLKVFRTVAEKLNFTNAAEALFLTQPAVTLQIKTLEEDLGVKLFDRSGGRVSMTEAGEVLLKYAARITDLYNEAEIAVGSLTGEERGRLAVGASTTIAQYVLPALLGEFLIVHPRVELSMLSANTENVIRALDEKRIALGLVEGPIGRNDLKTKSFIDDEIVAVVSATREWAKDSKISLKQLAEMPQIWREHGSGTRRV
ncbi:MAG: LysR substrate-binding domain-containing protein, partial [Pyrinomonadaceae bacterium]